MQSPATAHRHFLSGTTASYSLSRLNSTRPIRTPFSVRMSLREDAPSIAVVGVTGAVGQEFLSVLSDRSFPYRSIKMLASKRSAGKKYTFEDNEYVVEELTADSFKDVDIALFSAGGSISKEYGPIAVLRMVVSTYQAASGAGAAAMEELELQTREVLEGKRPTCNIFKQQYAFNLFSHNAPVLPNGYNEEEMKLVKETRKIWNDKDVKVTATCIRVPVMRAHAESVNLQFASPLDENEARDILKKAPGVVVVDDRAGNRFPTPLEVSNKDDVAVGRIRQDESQDGNHGLDIFVCGDQIRKGAALNAVQIAEMLL
ncbi:hypothetical protein E3N88_42083 [Mikania micrantha]|uniref:Semialdehyde dehydrogenase NAD-binding domain-containing protein n=1 Tax=Mikania micrantha TaxID=192012 RepID=A0A5N6LIR6_9ASTR|nr:hypothetical protein E3N88_42083 [Mikania micrantha]